MAETVTLAEEQQGGPTCDWLELHGYDLDVVPVGSTAVIDRDDGTVTVGCVSVVDGISQMWLHQPNEWDDDMSPAAIAKGCYACQQGATDDHLITEAITVPLLCDPPVARAS